MHTTFRITNGEPGASYHQRSRMYRYQPGNRQKEEKKTAAGRNSNDFLMGRILPCTGITWKMPERKKSTLRQGKVLIICTGQP